jgi:L-alanine-DL-glutamate epimerase-like enolase superfamily enzyme
MPDVKFCGGPVEAYLIGRELEARWERSVSMHCPSGPLSLLASAHATAAFGNKIPLEHAVYEVEWRHEVMEPFEQVENGYLLIPEGYGLGGRVDPVAIAMRGRTWTE